MRPSQINFLDRNFIIEIDNYNNNRKYDVDIISRAVELDRPEFLNSMLLSVFEGSQGPCIDSQTIKQDIFREATALGQFFTKSKNDSAAFLGNPLEPLLAMVDHRENEEKVELASFSKILEILPKENKATECAEKFNIFMDYVVANKDAWGMGKLAVLAAIFGNAGARGVLKLNKNRSEKLIFNAYSDLKKISMKPMLNDLAHQMNGACPKFRLVIGDVPLQKFSDVVEFNSVTSKNSISGFEVSLEVSSKKFIEELPFLIDRVKLKNKVIEEFFDSKSGGSSD
ncbi:hypothetical protein [Delftia acidovorans]|uniref:hypothetical protein n=1 Tax=Delftia acidovorans TaxID=80866 RepID=UPI00192B917D|nr:hypothetical protein [Delftia acidovorans]